MKFKVNDIVRVVKNTSGHYFNFGEEIKVISVNPSYYDAVSVADGTSFWCIYEADCEEIIKERFSDAQIGDKVICLLSGKGVITKKTESTIFVKFLDTFPCCYWKTGKLDEKHLNPSLFYDDGSGNMVIERPVSAISGSIVPVDAKMFVSDVSFEECNATRYFAFYNFSQLNVHCFSDELNSFNATSTCSWKYAILGEDITVDGITYLKGTRII